MQRNLKLILIAVARGAFTLLADAAHHRLVRAPACRVHGVARSRLCVREIAAGLAGGQGMDRNGARERARLVPVALRKLSEADSRSAEFSTRAATRSLTPFR